MKFSRIVLLFISSVFLIQNSFAVEWWQKIENDWTPSVVNIEMSWKNYLNGEDAIGASQATGFVVDAENGYVVTNAHVAGSNPGLFKITTFNNESIKARLKYIDPWHDFAILKYDPKELSFKAKEVVLGTQKELHAGDELVLIGNSSGEGLSAKTGNISKLFTNRGANTLARYSHYIHTSLPRAGGASGAPLWNKDGHVVGLHAIGREQESFELRIDYVADALKQIQAGHYPKRGDLFIKLSTLTWSEAQKYLLYPKSFVEAAPKENEELHQVLFIQDTLFGSKASELLKKLDVVVAFKLPTGEYKKIGYSLYDFDDYVNHHVGENITLQIFRRDGDSGKLLDVILPVADANQSFSKNYMSYAGAIFQDVTPGLALSLGTQQQGVFLSQADPGTTFYDVGMDVGRAQGRKNVVLKSINSQTIENLAMFQKIISGIKEDKEFTAIVCDFMEVNRNDGCRFLEMHFEPDEIPHNYYWNSTSLNWDSIH